MRETTGCVTVHRLQTKVGPDLCKAFCGLPEMSPSLGRNRIAVHRRIAWMQSSFRHYKLCAEEEADW